MGESEDGEGCSVNEEGRFRTHSIASGWEMEISWILRTCHIRDVSCHFEFLGSGDFGFVFSLGTLLELGEEAERLLEIAQMCSLISFAM